MLEGKGSFETAVGRMELPVTDIGNTGIKVDLWKKCSILALFILSFLIDIKVEILH